MSAPDYFRQYTNYFWQWEEEGEVAAVVNGNTIAYKNLLADIVEKLSGSGLPPFGSLLLALIATNADTETSLSRLLSVMSKLLDSREDRELLLRVGQFLELLSKLPLKYRQGRNRILLLQMLFENCHNRLPVVESTLIGQEIRSAGIASEAWSRAETFYVNLFKKEFRVIALMHKKFPDVATLIATMVSLPEIEEEIKLEQPQEAETIEKDFLETLIDNTKTFHIASLVKRLWSGLNIPYHSSLPSQQPLGGVSDLTNKGEFHRLLISEFAADDIVLLSRLANNEALYINRETPPQHNNLERIFLIDISIKNWGTPRTLAYALLLAIAKHPKTDIPCSAFAVGEDYHPIAFKSVDDVIESFQILEACLHPAQGIEKFFAAHGKDKNKEIFFISSNETFRQPALHKSISDHYGSFNYWVHTSESGGIDLYKRQQSGKKHIQHLALPLDELWQKAPKPLSSEQRISKSNYPILFPAASNAKKVIYASDGRIYIITAEKHLLELSRPPLGWILVYENLPFTMGDAQIGVLPGGERLLLIFHTNNREINIIDLDSGEKLIAYFTDWRKSVYREFLFHVDKFYYAYLGFPSKYWTFERSDSIIVQEFENIPNGIINELQAREQSDRERAAGRYPFRMLPVLKNIDAVYINETGNLVFNIHELRLINGHSIKMQRTEFRKKEIQARPQKDRFTFADGSVIILNRSGMLTLCSSNPEIDAIYVPSVLGEYLGMATENAFTGEEYYFPSHVGLERISPERFWGKYISSFIETIQSHGDLLTAGQ